MQSPTRGAQLRWARLFGPTCSAAALCRGIIWALHGGHAAVPIAACTVCRGPWWMA